MRGNYFLAFGRPVSLLIIFVFGMQVSSSIVTFIVSIPSSESMALESVMVKSIKGYVSLLTVGSFHSISFAVVAIVAVPYNTRISYCKVNKRFIFSANTRIIYFNKL